MSASINRRHRLVQNIGRVSQGPSNGLWAPAPSPSPFRLHPSQSSAKSAPPTNTTNPEDTDQNPVLDSPSLSMSVQKVLDGLRNLRFNDIISDFTIRSDSGSGWKIHKAILSIQSDVLYRMSSCSNFAESKNGYVVLAGFDDRIIEATVEFLYGLKVHHGRHIKAASDADHIKDSVIYFADLWRIADMYNVKGLSKAALWGFMNLVKRGTGEDVERIRVYLDTAAEIEAFPASMWKFLAVFCAEEWNIWSSIDPRKTKVLLEKHPDFAIEVLQAIIWKNSNSDGMAEDEIFDREIGDVENEYRSLMPDGERSEEDG